MAGTPGPPTGMPPPPPPGYPPGMGPRWTPREVDVRQAAFEATPGLTTPYPTGSTVTPSAANFAFGTPVRHGTVAPVTRVLFPSPSAASNPVHAPDVSYADRAPLAVAEMQWTTLRSELVANGVLIFQAFAVPDKQFQTLLTSLGLPTSVSHLCGSGAERDNAWRDLRERF